jgi:hypothetical protein
MSTLTMARLLLAALFALHVAAVNITVDLGYAKYRGKDIGAGVYRWAGMRYARSVSRVEGLRFTAPQDPLEERNIVDASEVRPPSHILSTKLTRPVWPSLHWHRN